jgi:hypothetical protein
MKHDVREHLHGGNYATATATTSKEAPTDDEM